MKLEDASPLTRNYYLNVTLMFLSTLLLHFKLICNFPLVACSRQWRPSMMARVLCDPSAFPPANHFDPYLLSLILFDLSLPSLHKIISVFIPSEALLV